MASAPSAGYSIPAILAFGGGYIIGTAINDIIKNFTGETLSEHLSGVLFR